MSFTPIGKVKLIIVAAAFVATQASGAEPESIYSWALADQPPANVVRAPGGPALAVCRAYDDHGFVWMGFWDGSTCIGNYGGSPTPASNGLRFLVVLRGPAGGQWVRGTNKIMPGDIGTVPSNLISGGRISYIMLNQVWQGPDQLLCSMDGRAGYIDHGHCSIGAVTNNFYESSVLVGRLEASRARRRR